MYKRVNVRPSRWAGLAVVIVVAAIGLYLVVGSPATSPAADAQPEAGTRQSSVVACDDTGASQDRMVRFGSNECIDTAIPDGQLIGWGKESKNFPSYMDKMLRLKDDTWLRVLTVHNQLPRTDLLFYTSSDNARTWTRIGSLNDRGRQMDNGFLHYAPDGTLLLHARSIIWGTDAELHQWHSDDNGKTWVHDLMYDSARNGTRGVWEPHVYNLPDGRMVLLYADETYSNFNQVISQRIASDNGKTWGPKQTVVSDGPDGRPGMAVVAHMQNGQYIMVYEVCVTRGCQVYQKYSADGLTWPEGIGTAVPDHWCGPYITSLSDGRLVLSSCGYGDSRTTKVHPISWSDDYGKTWKLNTPVVIGGDLFAYFPSLYQTAPNEIAYVHGETINFGRFVPRE